VGLSSDTDIWTLIYRGAQSGAARELDVDTAISSAIFGENATKWGTSQIAATFVTIGLGQ
jgi:hypothetical protein